MRNGPEQRYVSPYQWRGQAGELSLIECPCSAATTAAPIQNCASGYVVSSVCRGRSIFGTGRADHNFTRVGLIPITPGPDVAAYYNIHAVVDAAEYVFRRTWRVSKLNNA
jgi:hypothetical protein